jgi:putative zinc finger protein
MQHLDEGTIHAWLDGALGDAEAARVEAHVAGCSTCAAAVAEARGLIAGATRVLGALDHVPANVVPPALQGAAPNESATSAAGSSGVASLGERRRGWRRLHFTPAWTAAAAVIVVAVGSLLVARQAQREPAGRMIVLDRTGPGPRPPELAPVVASPPAADSMSTAQAVESVDSTAVENAKVAVQEPAVTRRTFADNAERADKKVSPKALVTENSLSKAEATAPAGLSERRAVAQTTADVAANPRKDANERSDSARERGVVGGVAGGEAKSAVASAAPAMPMQRAAVANAPVAAPAPQRLFDSVGRTAQRSAAGASAPTRRLAGERVSSPLRVGSASPLGETRCYELQSRADETALPRRFVLDTATYAVPGIAGAHAVIVPDSSTTRPRGYWYMGGGAVQVVWNNNAWPPLQILPLASAANLPFDSVAAVVNQNGYSAIGIRRCR